MAGWRLPIEGGCRCGKIRFRITEPPMLTMACHCAGCRKMSGSAFSLSVMAPSGGFEVTEGEPAIGGLHGDQARHYHCDWCKGWLFTRVQPDMGFVNIRAGALDTPDWFAPFIETYTSEALPWATTGARHSFPEFPPMDRYQPILAEFAAAQK